MKPSPTAAKRYHAAIIEAAGAGIDTHGIAAALGVTPGCVHHRTAELRKDGLIIAAAQDAGPKPVRWFDIEYAADAAAYQYPHTTSVRRKKERVKVPKPPKDLHAPWMEVLSAAGETGTTSALAGAALGFHPQTAATRLGDLVNRGLAVSRHEAGERAGSRLRYWLKGFEPAERIAKMPKAARLDADAPAILTGNERRVVGPANRDFRFTVKRLPEDYVSQIDPSQCRPWAMAAAR